jgi:ABC-type uncharacterized transport system permease subunit
MEGDRKLDCMSLSSGPFGLLGLCSGIALLGFAWAAWRPQAAATRWVFLTAWLAQALALVVDLGGLGHGQWGGRFGFAPALSLTVWLVLAVALAESRGALWTTAQRVLALVGAVTVLLALLFPGQPQAQHSPWAPLHWVLGLASYGLVGTAVLHAWLMRRAERQLRQPGGGGIPGWPLLRLERMTFQFLAVGVAVLTLALLLGWWFTPSWRWDHKTLFAVLAWVVLSGLLAGRLGLGWRGAQAVRWLYAGSALLLLSYVGSRFVLQVLLGRAA